MCADQSVTLFSPDTWAILLVKKKKAPRKPPNLGSIIMEQSDSEFLKVAVNCTETASRCLSWLFGLQLFCFTLHGPLTAKP